MSQGALRRPGLDAAQVERWLSLVCASPDAHRTTQRSPLDLEPTITVPHSTEDDVDRAFADAHAAQQRWAATSMRERARVLRRFHDLVLDRQALLCDVIQWENGKARTHAMDEVLDVALVSRYYARRSARLLAPKRRRGAFPLVTRTWELRAPKGVVAVISPWNYPLDIGVTDLIPAVMAGNGVVWKPDLQTMLTALIALDLLHAAGLPRGLVQVVAGEGPVVGPMLVDRGDYVQFTGSTNTGRTVAARAAQRLVGCSLELGGKNACIVLPDADLTKAVDIALRGAFVNAGQLCIGTERIFVHELIADAFRSALAAAARDLTLGANIGWGSAMGPLISPAQFARAEAHVRDAFDKGADLLVGGRPRPELGPLVYEPTVLLNVAEGMEAHRNETFGPVASLYVWRDEDELVQRVNDTEYGLSASIVTPSVRHARALAARLRVGGVNINEAFGAAYASIDAPMGGMRASGLGRRHGAEGLLKYTEAQTIAAQRVLPLAPGRFTDEQWARVATLALRILKMLRFR